MIRMERLRRWATIDSVAARLNQRTLTWVFVALVIVLGAFQSLDPAHVIDPDGISYLDMGDALLRGEWQSAVNGLWSPLYAWLHGLAHWLLQPAMQWDFAVVQLVNGLIYLAALAAFHFCLTQLLACQRSQPAQANSLRLPAWIWVALGYTLFIWSSLALITVTRETPDLLVAGCVYAAAGLSLRIRRGRAGWLNFILLGAVLGLGYMAKAFIFAIAFVVIAVSSAALGDWRRTITRGFVAIATFLLVSGPLLIVLSSKYGRPTFSDQGAITYLMHINHVPFVHWQGDDLGRGVDLGVPLHPSRKIHDDPDVFEFGSPVGGTYPPWFEVGYWFEGVNPTFDLSSHLRVLEASIGVYFEIFLLGAGSMLAVLLAMGWMGGRDLTWENALEGWPLVIPAVAALALFSVVHVEPRYTAPFVTLLLLGLLYGARLPRTAESQRAVTGLALGACLVMLTITAAQPIGVGYNVARDLARGRDPWPQTNLRVAEALVRVGLQPGDRVAVVGSGFHASGWARLARLRIVAELPLDQAAAFWALDESRRAEVLRLLASTGARVAVAEGKPGWVRDAAWQQIGNTDHYVFVLSS